MERKVTRRQQARGGAQGLKTKVIETTSEKTRIKYKIRP